MDTKGKLLDRWKDIEEEEEEEEDNHPSTDHSSRLRFQQLKEEWFSDAFNFLIHLSKQNHIWCGSWDLMGPLLETFYNYFEDERFDSPLKILWKRISEELRCCTQCICQHHQAQESYSMEYESNSIGPLIVVLRSLDEERVTAHLKEINSKVACGDYDSVRDNAEVVSVMFEVLKFPVLLDDQSLVPEFQIFIEAVDNYHELTLDGHEQYPGVYALLFLKSIRARSIGLRLAKHLGKLRKAEDLEPLQPLLKRYICFLETEVLPPSTARTYRPRVKLERSTVWQGIKTLLGFLEPPAFEEGILEHYNMFPNIVVNHLSDDSLEFSYAVNCLRILFEMLGCKLWLMSSLSPSIMRNTLLSQCFHTRNEKSHKDIFDLFQPFMQSLEALQDGEHEKERRHFLYFLLHQVTVSSNFSMLMRKKACQIALRIIHRGYQMNPPCPPFECAHMWGPSLVSSLKDLSLHSSLRQPAFDLIQTIIVSDAAALVSALLNSHTPPIIDGPMSTEFNDEDEDQGGLPFARDVREKKDNSCWKEFSAEGKIAAQEYGCWMCIPMLWAEVLIEIDPLMLPVSFSKAVFWSLSRLSMVEPLNSSEMVLPVRNWLTTYASEISYLFGWKAPSGSDDGGDGKESKNSAKVSTVCVPLMRTFKRLSTDYIVKMEQGEVWKPWNWEPRMGESLILLLVDPDDNARQVARRVLEKVSKVRTLACGLQFLCSCSSSLSAIFFGLRHALKLVQLDAVLLKFQMLHNFFFVLCKVLKEGITYSETQADDATKDSTQGGFLQQPVFDSLPNDNNTGGHLQNVDSTSWEMFSCLLSVIAWPSILKCLAEGKAFIDCKTSQMTCIRLLETVPIVFERLRPSFHRLSRNVGGMIVECSRNDFKWLLDLMDWGKSRLAVIVRYWKQTVLSLLGQLKWSCSDDSVSMIRAINKIITSDNVSMDELAEHVSRLSVSLVNEEGSYKFEKTSMMKSGPLFTDGLLPKTKCISKSAVVEDAVVQTVLDSASSVNEEKNKVIIVSDDDMDTEIPAIGFHHGSSSQPMLDGSSILDNHGASERVVQCDLAKGENISCIETSLKMLKTSNKTGASDSCGFVSQKLVESEATKCRASLLRPKAVENIRKDTTTSSLNKNGKDSVTYQNKLKNASNDTISKRIADSFPSQLVSTNVEKNSSYNATTNTTKTSGQYGIKKVSKNAANIVIRELVHDSDDDPLELALKAAAAGRQQASIAKVNACGPKRQVIQLNLPVENRFANLHRMDGRKIRFKPPKLDDWYKPILELDYFATVGLTTEEEDNKTASKLKEVPVSFQSPDEYVSIFRPLVLEEFKAQLQSSFIEMSSSDEMCCGSLSVMSVERVDDFHIVRCVHDDIDASGSKRCVENDLILLTRQQFRSTSQDVHMVGKVEKREKDNNRRSNILAIRFYFQNTVPRLNRARKLLLERSKWFISRLVSITPQLREFQALSSIRNIPLLPLILNPTNHPSGRSESREKYLTKLSTPLQQILKLSFNDSQVQAISAGIGPVDLKMDFGLSLIQGPPGTGKTRTIVAIVSGLLAMHRMIDKKRQNDNIKSTTSNNTSYVNKKVPMSQSAAIARAWQDAALARQVNDDELEKKGKFMGSSSCTTKGRVLMCAQSNAAVDELVSRISNEGLYGSDGVMYKPYLVRVGNAKTVHPNSLPFFIDTLVEHRLAKERRINVMGDPKNEDSSSTVLRSNLEKLADRISFYEAKRANLRDDGNNSGSKGLLLEGEVVHPNVKEMSDAEIGARLRKLYADRQAVSRDIAAAQAREKKVDEESRALKHKLRKSILREAEIVVTTLSGCGGDLYAVCSETISSQKFGSSLEHTLFDAVVIDEAAQALEPATLIPLQLLKSKGTKCIMVGDPKQLPATVLSNVASKYMYQCSMLERLQRAGHPVLMLTKQYRMHPEICRFPSQHFYDGKLLNGDDMSTRELPSFHKTEFLGPYVFFDIVDGQELRGNNFGVSSFYNECEADAAVEILKYFRRHTSDFSGGRIGIVTPYKGQLSLLRQRFSYAFGSSVTAEMEFNTVDGFQGREVDILILSTVRGMGPPCSTEHRIKESSSSNIGFVADARRMNVALTRAKHSLWILGNARTLTTNKNWEALVRDARKRHLVISIKKPYTSMFCNNAAWKKSPILERSDADHSPIQLSEEVGGLAEQQHKKVTNSSDERKRKCIGGGRRDVKNIVVGREEHTSFPSKGEADKAATCRRKAKSEHNDGLSSVKKDLGTAVEDSTLIKTVNLRKSSIVTGNKSRGQMSNEKQQSDVGNSDRGNGEGHQKLVKKAVSLNGGVSESSENDKRQRQSMDIDKNPVRRSFQERRDVTLDKALASKHQFENSKQDSIAKRKQQREAVDALLSSALISTKKSSLPVKRPISPTNAATAGHSIKPPKPRKVTEGYKREMGPGAGGVER